MRRSVIGLAALLLSSCAYTQGDETDHTEWTVLDDPGVEIPMSPVEEPPVPPTTVQALDEGAREGPLAGDELNEMPWIDGAAIEERVQEAIEQLPELAADVEWMEVSETDVGLSVRGVVSSQDAFDDVHAFVQRAAPGVTVVNDLVIVIPIE